MEVEQRQPFYQEAVTTKASLGEAENRGPIVIFPPVLDNSSCASALLESERKYENFKCCVINSPAHVLTLEFIWAQHEPGNLEMHSSAALI